MDIDLRQGSDAAQLAALCEGTAASNFKIHFTLVDKEWLEAEMPLDPKIIAVETASHAALAILCETVGCAAASVTAGSSKICLGRQLQINYLRPVVTERVKARANPVSVDDDRHIWQIRVCDFAGYALSLATLTVNVLAREDAAKYL